MHEVFYVFYNNLIDTSIWEFIAVITGIGSVWFARTENILVYPVGIVSVLIYVFICFNAQLYADAGINFFYFVMSVYGWYKWTHINGEVKVREISAGNWKNNLINIGLTIISFWLILAIILYFNRHDLHYVNSNIPYIDSLTTAIFLIGMWLMALKRIENWIYWIIGDLISIPLYFYKGLVFTSIQYLVFLIIAILGYIEWKNRYIEKRLYA